MQQFETERLIIRSLSLTDTDAYFDMMCNKNVMRLIPRPVMDRNESNTHLSYLINQYQKKSDLNIWGIELKTTNEFIGLCGFLKSKEKTDEIGYRLREQFWRKGYGTEITKGLISHGFSKLNMSKITADVAVNNINSVKILEKFMTLQSEFFNSVDNCMDKRYVVLANNWKNL